MLVKGCCFFVIGSAVLGSVDILEKYFPLADAGTIVSAGKVTLRFLPLASYLTPLVYALRFLPTDVDCIAIFPLVTILADFLIKVLIPSPKYLCKAGKF